MLFLYQKLCLLIPTSSLIHYCPEVVAGEGGSSEVSRAAPRLTAIFWFSSALWLQDMYVPYFLSFSGLTHFKNLYFYNAMCNKGSVSQGLDQGKTCNEQGNDEL
jgi:hypothetical protein